MKSIKKIILITLLSNLISIFLTLSTSLKTQLKSKAKAKSKSKSKTISFNYLNNKNTLKSTSKSSAKSKTKTNTNSKSKMNEDYSFSKFFEEAPEAKQPKPANPKDSNGKKHLDNWLKISSTSFKNPALHPEINNYGQMISVKADFADFRLNDAYKKNVSPELEPKEERDFWFRLRDFNIYYSNTKTDLNILGEIRFNEIDEIISIDKSEDGHCFTVSDNLHVEWRLCSNDMKIRNLWVCTLEKAANKPLTDYCLNEGHEDAKIITKDVNKVLLIFIKINKKEGKIMLSIFINNFKYFLDNPTLHCSSNSFKKMQ